ncbi:hypothetical protein [Simiduia agarivorans]|uniref:Lipoprotein n=1 Tax=Simiduia agarivorans (strain DSM 21679 / JCM 13881 / BCRC 17597 / SA1) TaxID=1117647 RepID=K4KYT3_SIMAS|nr:hypothetical protein [Simiduia agarivorans]AFU99097.1 hypothetical protein M5M_09560 [Simiduia agarivorans SA1 = DSM 21679]
MKVRTLATTLLMTFAASATFAATCDNAALPAMPGIPAADERSFESMLAAQNDVKTYVTASKEYLKCVRSSSRHNALVDQIYAVADEYNTALAEFQASTR